MSFAFKKLKRLRKNQLDQLCLAQSFKIQEKQRLLEAYHREQKRIAEAAVYASEKPLYRPVFEDFRRISEERCWLLDRKIQEKQQEIQEKKPEVDQAFHRYVSLDLWFQTKENQMRQKEDKKNQALVDQWNALKCMSDMSSK